MRALVSRLATLALFLGLAAPAHAIVWPSGQLGPTTGGPCPDTLDIFFMQDATQLCGGVRPAAGDTVLGVAGVVTGYSGITAGGFGIRHIWIQYPAGGQYSGIDLFTSSSDYHRTQMAVGPAPDFLTYGDQVQAYGDYSEFNGDTELRCGTISTWRFISRYSGGNPLPPFHNSQNPHEFNHVVDGTSGTRQEPWENCLVRITPPAGQHMIVRRSGLVSSHQGLGVTSTAELVVMEPGFTGDSILVDGFYASHTVSDGAVAMQPEGTEIDAIQGIMYQATVAGLNRYGIVLRNENDLSATLPPAILDAYVIDTDKVRIIFDKAVTAASATPAPGPGLEAAYTFDTGNTPTSAAFEGGSGNKIVILTFENSVGVQNGDVMKLTISNIVGDPSGLTMDPNPVDRFLRFGVLTISELQAPDAVRLGGNPCADGSRWTSAGGFTSARLAWSGVCTTPKFSSTTFVVEDPIGSLDSGVRHGIHCFAPSQLLVEGHQYLFVSQFQEFDGNTTQTPGGLTEASGFVYIKDQGAVGMPAPRDQTIKVLIDETCSPTPEAEAAITTGEDFEGVLVRLKNVRVIEDQPADTPFLVAGPIGTFTDQILIDTPGGDVSWTFVPVLDHTIDVTGILSDDPTPQVPPRTTHPNYTQRYRLLPRGDADFVDHGLNAGVGDGAGGRLSLSVSPNPSRSPRVSFALPQESDVDLSIYDLSGRKITTLLHGRYPAGDYSKAWNGRDASGNPVRSGVFFYGLQVGADKVTARAVKLD